MSYQTEYRKWLESPALDDAQRAELAAIEGNEAEIEDRFYAPLAFGTAGLRGVLGMGTNRMNVFVVRQATQAIANMICSLGEDAKKQGVAIAYDPRHYSREFAEAAAGVCAAAGVQVYIFDDIRPTPELSYAIRHLGCIAGINVTASHNPKQYNGYKAYWSDGAQLPTKESDIVSGIIDTIDIFTGVKCLPFDEGVEKGLIHVIGRDVDEPYLDYVLGLVADKQSIVDNDLLVVYTPFHGAGYKLVPEALTRLGVRRLVCEPRQMIPDGDFPTVVSPNPQDIEGFADSIVLAKEKGADIIIGSDPDADRLAAVARDADGEYRALTGNQLGCLLLEHEISVRRDMGTMPAEPRLIKSIVSTDMARVIAEKNGVGCDDVFTGFKNIAEKIAEYEKTGVGEMIFAFEESNGYMSGPQTRDKDAVNAAVLVVEMAARYKARGMTLHDGMRELYKKYGYFREETLNFVMPGVDGLADMKKLMASLHAAPPKALGRYGVSTIVDYLAGTQTDTASGRTEKISLSGSDVICLRTAQGDSFIIRPSGTEPKIRNYIMISGADAAECAAKAEVFLAAAKEIMAKKD
ncbi:MAG: phospho-sugar mutase [Oscillospiraceae bacterium]|nr:phospho-sugar mutase [Oscillospiraceae bacterium]